MQLHETSSDILGRCVGWTDDDRRWRTALLGEGALDPRVPVRRPHRATSYQHIGGQLMHGVGRAVRSTGYDAGKRLSQLKPSFCKHSQE